MTDYRFLIIVIKALLMPIIGTLNLRNIIIFIIRRLPKMVDLKGSIKLTIILIRWLL